MALILPLAAGLLAGTLLLQSQQTLPPTCIAYGLVGLGAMLSLFSLSGRLDRRLAWGLVCVAALTFGYGTGALRATVRLQDRLAASLEGQDIAVRGRIVEMPRRVDHGIGFVFETLDPPVGVPSRLQLSWYRNAHEVLPDLRAGEAWALTVRLKRPHGSLNPHGSDREAQMLSQRLGASGYVRESRDAERLPDTTRSPMIIVEQWRQEIRDRFERALPDSPWRAVLVALAIGDQDGVSSEQWTLFSRSGITHLISISGLHVTIWALVAGSALAALWRRVPWLALRLPAQSAGALFGLLAATAYVALAGAAVPAQRSLVMLAVVAFANFGGRAVRPVLALAAALVAVLLWDPWCVLSKGTWLSFIAVALLLWAASPHEQSSPAWRRWLAAQWAIGLGMLPALLALTGQMSWVAPVANLVAVPLVTFVLLPLEFLFVVLNWAPLLHLAAWLFGQLAEVLAWLSGPQWAVWQQAAAPLPLILAASVAAVWQLAPRGAPGRGAAAVILLSLLCWHPARPPKGSFEMTMLDVGQGLAVHVRTAAHDLVFDTGPRFGTSSDAGQRIVVPYLRGEGVNRLSGVVVSHDDSDHAGGAAAVLGAITADWLMGSLPTSHLLRGAGFRPCARGDEWAWDGVVFEVLHPAPGRALGGNRNSCVIRVRSGVHTALLAADIELASERELIEAGLLGPVDVVIAPHHGSRSSSGDDFVHTLSPRWVLYAVGYRSRFGHPHAEVTERYREAGAEDLRSDRDGAIQMRFAPDGVSVTRWRDVARRYWHAESSVSR
ncbi:DNA internalization-related competence protein ComEC/Rec2 [Niveibacterium sp.]|uniref:DNA internalization-related competence protein ComEC/Rec2 n=1 Tax=Niveibacterium sp. TaxID=2017444 RepID=UPI0035B468C0